MLIGRMGVDRVWIVAGQELPACRLMANQHRDADKILDSHKNKKVRSCESNILLL